MTRSELANEVYKRIYKELNLEYTEAAIWKSIAETDDCSLEEFLYRLKAEHKA